MSDSIINSINRKHVRKVVIDVASILTLGIPILIFFKIGVPYKRGFNCDDESIRYPYRDNTISAAANYLYSTLIPAITIIVIESGYWVRSQKRQDRRALHVASNSSKFDLIWSIYCYLSAFVFGAVISQFTTDIAKYTIGRLRPHFIDVCEPKIADGTIFTLRNATFCTEYQFQYLIDYECTNEAMKGRWKDSRLSFMSGHSSFAAYCLIFLVIYLQVRLKWSVVGFIKPLYQALCVYLVIYTGFSRISDYKHHWSDVLIGLLQGTIVAILTAVFISNLFVKKKISSDSESTNGLQPAININSNYNSFPVEMEENMRKAS